MRCRLITALSFAALLLAGAPLPSHGAPARTVRVYPAQVGSCEPSGTGFAQSRKLVTRPATSRPCPAPATTATLRQDERYPLAERVSGHFLPHASEVVGQIVFEQVVRDVATPGYVDADVTVLLNGHAVTVHTAGLITPAVPHKATFRLPVPAAVRGRAVSSVVLDVHWRQGTTPGVEPDLTGESFAGFPVYTPPRSVTTRFELSVAQAFGNAPCPAGTAPGSLCFAVSGRGPARGLGTVEMRRVVALRQGNGCPPARTIGTLTVPGKGAIDVTASGSWCPNDGSARYSFRVTGGTGRFKGATGSGTLTVPPLAQGARDVWRGSVTYRTS